MKKELKSIGKFSVKKELSRSELKLVMAGTGTVQTYCTCAGAPPDTCNPFPVTGSTAIGCQPLYCAEAGHGTFDFCE
jgi:hypothetical protein